MPELQADFSSPVYMNTNGYIVDNIPDSYGCKVAVSLNLPQLCVVMNEVRGDLEMLNDGNSGRSKYVCHKGDAPKFNATKKKKKLLYWV